MMATDAPKADITKENIQGSFVGTMTYHARLANGSLVYLFKTTVQVGESCVRLVFRWVEECDLFKTSVEVGGCDLFKTSVHVGV